MAVSYKLIAHLLKKLQTEVKGVKSQYPALSPDNAFVLWFAEAYIVGDRSKAFDGITGGKGDKTVDAVYVDERNQVIQIVQGKYYLSDASSDSELYKFGKRAADLRNPTFEEELKHAGPGARKRLLEAHKLLNGKNDSEFKLKMYFASSGKITSKCAMAAKRSVARLRNTELEVLDRPAILRVLAGWLEGSSPPLPEMEINVDGPYTLTHQEGKTDLRGWIFTTTANELIRLFNEAEERLFARNVRGFLGIDTSINQEIRKTASKTPERFWFLNNGITIVADYVEKIESGNATRMRMRNPQVVNGQQTVRALANVGPNLSKVLVRVIRLEQPLAKEGIVGVVGEVVRATNRQNAIKQADLMANDPEQVRIERECRKVNYAYQRKRQEAKEFAPKAFGHKKIKREDLANALSTTLEGAQHVRRTEQWEPTHYHVLFNEKRPISDYLSRWWVAQIIEDMPTVTSEARWVVLDCLWKWADLPMRDCLKSEGSRRAFIKACETNDQRVLRHITGPAKQLFSVAKSIYVGERKSFAEEVKHSARKRFKVLTPDAFFRRESVSDKVAGLARKDSKRRQTITIALKEFGNRVASAP